MLIIEAFLGVLGLVILVVGADVLVRGASRLALGFGVAPLVVGLTIVAFGTSAPEFAVSLQTSLQGSGAIALGNVIGSNIFNILAILGLCSLIVPQGVDRKLVRFDIPLMMGASVGVLLLSRGGVMVRWQGALLLGALLLYTGNTWWQGRKAGVSEGAGEVEELAHGGPAILEKRWAQVLALVLGLLMLVGGSQLLVNAAVTLARSFGVSELMIGLTIIAAGTSLPELATSAMASYRGERDIAVGNVIGSNIFNLLGVLGVTILASPTALIIPEQALRVDLPVMVGAALLTLPLARTGYRFSRVEGAVLLIAFLAYWGYVIVASMEPR